MLPPNKGVLQNKKSSSPKFEQIFAQQYYLRTEHQNSGDVRNIWDAWQPYRNHSNHRNYLLANKLTLLCSEANQKALF